MVKSKKEARVAGQRHNRRWADGESPTNEQPTLPMVVCALASLALVASLASITSQLLLSPVFGGIPASLNHASLKLGCFVLAWVSAVFLGSIAPARLRLAERAPLVLPWISLVVPLTERAVWLWSAERLGPRWGPLASELVTFAPIYFLSVLGFAARFASIFQRQYPRGRVLYFSVAALLSWLAFETLGGCFRGTVDAFIGSTWLITRCGLRTAVGVFSVAAAPSFLTVPALVGLLATIPYNPTCYSNNKELLARVNGDLAASNFTLLARAESVTGYISVLENTDKKFRILRCDHSILGGEWRGPGSDDPDTLNEPIYSVFVMLEAVRLIDPPAIVRSSPEALLIGLGIGTAASGLIKSGVSTTVVELDHVVYQYAREYFSLPSNHTAHITDAVDFVSKQAKAPESKKYDYIVHDVFTGGAVPSVLFTLEFLQELKSLLKEDGIIAINYAGDLKLRAARMILNTIVSVFENCRAFREDDPSHADGSELVDFTNMVIFCVPFHKGKAASQNEKIPHFHAPREEDFHGTWIRRQFLMPKFEIDLRDALSPHQRNKPGDAEKILIKRNVQMLSSWQKQSAVNHWTIMNTVIPIPVWINY